MEKKAKVLSRENLLINQGIVACTLSDKYLTTNNPGLNNQEQVFFFSFDRKERKKKGKKRNRVTNTSVRFIQRISSNRNGSFLSRFPLPPACW